jgi:hypothetical protein
MSTTLHRLEAANDDPFVCGVLLSFDSGTKKTFAWRQEQLVSPALEGAKLFTAQVIDALVKEGREADVRNTNWVSVCAAIHKIVRDWNGEVARFHKERHAATIQ